MHLHILTPCFHSVPKSGEPASHRLEHFSLNAVPWILCNEFYSMNGKLCHWNYSIVHEQLSRSAPIEFRSFVHFHCLQNKERVCLDLNRSVRCHSNEPFRTISRAAVAKPIQMFNLSALSALRLSKKTKMDDDTQSAVETGPYVPMSWIWERVRITWEMIWILNFKN